jgi:hypothetical protein
VVSAAGYPLGDEVGRGIVEREAGEDREPGVEEGAGDDQPDQLLANPLAAGLGGPKQVQQRHRQQRRPQGADQVGEHKGPRVLVDLSQQLGVATGAELGGEQNQRGQEQPHGNEGRKGSGHRPAPLALDDLGRAHCCLIARRGPRALLARPLVGAHRVVLVVMRLRDPGDAIADRQQEIEEWGRDPDQGLDPLDVSSLGRGKGSAWGGRAIAGHQPRS